MRPAGGNMLPGPGRLSSDLRALRSHVQEPDQSPPQSGCRHALNAPQMSPGVSDALNITVSGGLIFTDTWALVGFRRCFHPQPCPFVLPRLQPTFIPTPARKPFQSSGSRGCCPLRPLSPLLLCVMELITICLLSNGSDLWAGTIHFPAGPTTSPGSGAS